MIRVSLRALVFLGCSIATGCGTDGGGGAAQAGSGGASPGSAGAGSANRGGASSGGAGSSAAGAPGFPGASGGLGAAGAVGSSGTSSLAGAGNTPLFSDDFEAATIDPGKWTPRSNGGAMFELDKTQKHGGAQALHLLHSGFSSLLAAEGAPIFPAPNGAFYGRLWLRVAPVEGGGLPQGHVIWFEAGDVTNDTHEVRVGMNIGKFQSNLFWQGEVDIRDPGAKLMPNTWHCIQFEYGPDLLEVSLDGARSSISTTTWVAADQANGSTSTTKTGWSPSYAAFRIGWELGSGEIWYDDVALGHAPIACD